MGIKTEAVYFSDSLGLLVPIIFQESGFQDQPFHQLE